MARFDHKHGDYQKLEAAALAVLAGYALSVRRREMTAAVFASKAGDHLKLWHPEAASIGRVAATGGAAGIQNVDREIGGAVAEKQIGYLHGFAEDITAGRYDGEMSFDAEPGDSSALASRAEMYGMALLGTAMAGWAGAQSKDAEINWVTESDNPCADCEMMAAGNPYTAATLPTTPASGDTKCLSRCRCSLEEG